MKLLVLTPLGQENLFANEKLAKMFAQDAYFLDCVGLEDFFLKTKQVKNEEEAIIRTMIAVELKAKEIKKNDLLVVLGNGPKTAAFDMIVRFDNGVEQITNEYDPMLTHVSKKFKEVDFVQNYYKPEDCESTLKFAELIAPFIRKVIGKNEIQQGTTSVNKQ